MGAPSEYYVDPSLGSDTGDGTVGTPWGRASGSVIQYALDTGITRDATNGDRINVKAGTDDVLAANLVFTTYGTPTIAAPIIIQGYTSAAGDEGIGGIDGDGSFGIIDTATDYVRFVDLHIHNSGASQLMSLDNGIFIVNCELDGCSHNTSITCDQHLYIANCYFHDLKLVEGDSNTFMISSYFKNDGTSDFGTAANLFDRGWCINCIFSLDGASIAIELTNNSHAIGNSILSSAGTGTGILINDASQPGRSVVNNLIEGFSGAGGKGIDFDTSTSKYAIYTNNAFYNNTTDEANTVADMWAYENDNESLGSSPFAKSGADTFANRFEYFKPLDVGNVLGGGYQ